MISKQVKNERVKSLSQSFKEARAAFLVSCKGLNVERMTALRKALAQAKGSLRIERNTLSLLSLKEAPDLKPHFAPLLKGPNGYVFALSDDVPSVAKALDSFASDSEAFQIKLGVMGGAALSAEDVKSLARLPSQEALRGQLLAALSAAPGGFLRLLQAPAAGFLRLLAAYQEKKEAN